MKLLQTILLVGIISSIFLSCNNFKYHSIAEFLQEKEDIRRETITSILVKNDIQVTNKFVVTYIDYVLTAESGLWTLKKQFPTPDFKEFINSAVPTLYYAYSPDVYKSAPAKWREESKKFLVNDIPYDFSYGEAKFRELLVKKLEMGIVVFRYYSQTEPDKAAVGDAMFASWFTNYAILGEYFTFSDFKKFSAEDQSKLLYADMKISLIFRGKVLTDELDTSLHRFCEVWKLRREQYMCKPAYKNISDNTGIGAVLIIIRNMLLGRT